MVRVRAKVNARVNVMVIMITDIAVAGRMIAGSLYDLERRAKIHRLLESALMTSGVLRWMSRRERFIMCLR